MRGRLAPLVFAGAVVAAAHGMGSVWLEEFDLSRCTLQATGRSPYFILEPGFQLLLEGGDTRLMITVLDQTREVDGVLTRAVEEREWKDGQLHEVSTNYFALCAETRDVYYFGEEVDFYEKGKVVKHEGAWLAGTNGNRPGLIMPGSPKVGMKYYQEFAPSVAMDRAEVVSLAEICHTPAGTFYNCLKIRETTPLEFWASEYKYHAPGIGLVRDEDLQLIRFGFAKPTSAPPQ